jgi:hypothetical protein
MKTLKNLAYCLLLVVAVLGLNACGGTDAVKPAVPSASMTAKIDGKSFRATAFQRTKPPEFMVTGAIPFSDNITLFIKDIKVGEYDLSKNSYFFDLSAMYSPNGGDMNAPVYASTSGKIIITEVTSNKVKGTFNFVGTSSRLGNTINVTDGVFDYSF